MIDTMPKVPNIQELHLPQMLTIKQVSEVMHLPQHYIRRLCKTVPGLAFNSGNKYYVNLEHLSAYFNGK